MNTLKLLKAMFTSAPRLAAPECLERVRSGDALLIDVREPHEWTGGVAERAVLLPLSDLTGRRAQWRPFLAVNAGRQFLLYCAAGGRSAIAARMLATEGFRTANAGSLSEWASAGWPVVPPSAGAASSI
jgi:rhodanese-related sulfurtransferase